MNKTLLALVMTAGLAAHAQTSSVSAPSSQTSSTTLSEQKPEAAKKWTAQAAFDSYTAAANQKNSAEYQSNLGDLANETGLLAQVGYKVSSKGTLSYAKMFNYKFVGNTPNENMADGKQPQENIKNEADRLQYSQGGMKFLGSEEFVNITRLYNYAGSQVKQNVEWRLRNLADIPWVQTPRWTAIYSYDASYTYSKDSTKGLAYLQNTAKLQYSLNDKVQPYAAAYHYLQSISSSDLARRADLAGEQVGWDLGVDFSFGNLALTAELDQMHSIMAGNTAFGLLRPEEVTYHIAGAYSF